MSKVTFGRSQTLSTRFSVRSANLHCITWYRNKEFPSKMACDHWPSSFQWQGPEIPQEGIWGRGQREENRWNPSTRPRSSWPTRKPDESGGREIKKTPKRSCEETTCSTRNHGRPASRSKSQRKRAARNWKRGSTELMKRCIPRDQLLPGKKYRQEDRGQARNGSWCRTFG